jgi:hypothetical protein
MCDAIPKKEDLISLINMVVLPGAFSLGTIKRLLNNEELLVR